MGMIDTHVTCINYAKLHSWLIGINQFLIALQAHWSAAYTDDDGMHYGLHYTNQLDNKNKGSYPSLPSSLL